MQLRELAGHRGRVRRAARIVLVVATAMMAFAGSGAGVRADTPDGPDTPLIRKVSVNTTRVRPDQTIKVRIDVGDRWGIMDSPYIEYRKADGVVGPAAFFKRVSGGIHNGVWEASLYFDEYAPYGDAYVSRLYAYDRHGHTTNLWEGEGVLADAKITIIEYVDPTFTG